ncbi:MAG: hypothetical protein JTJ09_06045 [Enterococcus sp.]|nr:hypothetical protein [Enterococcus sp.]
MITFKNEIKVIDPVRLWEVDYGDFFEFDNNIYQKLSWDETEEQFDCRDPSSMNYIGIRFDEYVRPVDVEITAIGYTKE